MLCPQGGAATPGRGGGVSKGDPLLPQTVGCSDAMGERGGGSSLAPPGCGVGGELMATRGGPVLEPGWLLSPAGRPYRDSILQKNQRRVFGEYVCVCVSPKKK